MTDILMTKRQRSILEKLLRPWSPEEREILERNQILRTQETSRMMSSMRMELSIPTRHLAAIKAVIPELSQETDKLTRVQAWKKFLRDPISKQYRVR